jgi:hypothetical protein
MDSDETIFPMVLTHPFFLILTGKSQSGKTTFLLNLLKNSKSIINHRIERIIYLYSSDQPGFHDKDVKNLGIIFTRDLDDFEKYLVPNSILIFDDLFLTLKEKKYNDILVDMAIRRSHHERISCIFLTQVFFDDKYNIIKENATYHAIFKPNQNRAKTLRLLSQIYPGMREFFVSVLNRVANVKYSYLFISQDDGTPFQFSVRNCLYPSDLCEIFTPQNEPNYKRKKISE